VYAEWEKSNPTDITNLYTPPPLFPDETPAVSGEPTVLHPTSQTPGDILPTPLSPTPINGIVSCEQGVNIRSTPSTERDSPGTLQMNTTVFIVGITRTDSEHKDWYRIEHRFNDDNYWWVTTTCVKVGPVDVSSIRELDNSGNPIDSTDNTP
jgi:hypothetical protein